MYCVSFAHFQWFTVCVCCVCIVLFSAFFSSLCSLSLLPFSSFLVFRLVYSCSYAFTLPLVVVFLCCVCACCSFWCMHRLYSPRSLNNSNSSSRSSDKQKRVAFDSPTAIWFVAGMWTHTAQTFEHHQPLTNTDADESSAPLVFAYNSLTHTDALHLAHIHTVSLTGCQLLLSFQCLCALSLSAFFAIPNRIARPEWNMQIHVRSQSIGFEWSGFHMEPSNLIFFLSVPVHLILSFSVVTFPKIRNCITSICRLLSLSSLSHWSSSFPVCLCLCCDNNFMPVRLSIMCEILIEIINFT